MRLLALIVLGVAGCIHTPAVIDSRDEEKCSVHGTPLHTEEVPVWIGRISRNWRFGWDEEIRRFPNANDRSISIDDTPDNDGIESALISFCPDCRRDKDAVVEALERQAEPASSSD